MPIDYSKLYFPEELQVERDGIKDSVTVQLHLLGNESPDCRLHLWNFNTWFRTPYGIKGKKYNSIASMKNAVIRCLTANGFTCFDWVSKV